MINFDVSVVIISYNPTYEKLRKTISSILLQVNISFEIIICDDGSKHDFYDECVDYFKQNKFSDYKIIRSTVNRGIVLNYLEGVRIARGKFIKPISPGDYLYASNTLYLWLNFLNLNSCKNSFGRGVYYNDSKEFKIIKHRFAPKSVELYKIKLNSLTKHSCLLLDDMALGAAYITERTLLLDYLTKIEGRIKLGEDFIYSLMQYNNEFALYYDNKVIWYEYGNGISSSDSSMYSPVMKKDLTALHEIILEFPKKSFWEYRLQYLFKRYYSFKNYRSRRVLKCLLFPEILLWKLYFLFFPSYTDTNVDIDFFKRL